MPAWFVQHCRCKYSSSHVLKRNGFTKKRAAPVVNLHYFTLKLLILMFSSENIIVLHLKYVLLYSLT